MRGDNFSSCVVLRISKTYAEIHGKSSPQAQNVGSKWGFFSKAGLYLSFSKAGLYPPPPPGGGGGGGGGKRGLRGFRWFLLGFRGGCFFF